MMTSLHSHSNPFRNDYAGSRTVEIRRDLRFRYAYICRLIDDSELQGLPAGLRAKTRKLHKDTYWRNISLMRRDAERVLKLRRERMAAQRQWDFASLVADYTRVQIMLAKLTLAGAGHSMHVATGLDAAREALREFEAFLTVPSSPLVATA